MAQTHTVHGAGLPPWAKLGPVTTAAPFDRPAITARVRVDDETTERDLPGRALGWTKTLVQVRVVFDGQQFDVWVAAEKVTRRDDTASDSPDS